MREKHNVGKVRLSLFEHSDIKKRQMTPGSVLRQGRLARESLLSIDARSNLLS